MNNARKRPVPSMEGDNFVKAQRKRFLQWDAPGGAAAGRAAEAGPTRAAHPVGNPRLHPVRNEGPPIGDDGLHVTRHRGGRTMALPAIPWQAIDDRWACRAA